MADETGPSTVKVQPDSTAELVAELKAQRESILKLLEEKQKPRWRETFSTVSPFISGLLVAAIGWYFTYSYNQQQIRVNRISTVEKLIPQLIGGSAENQRGALLAIASLEDERLAIRLATIMDSQGANDALSSMLFDSVRTEDTSLAKILLAAGANPNVTAGGVLPVTPLHVAVMTDNPQMIRLLISAGALPTLVVSGNKYDPLTLAALEGKVKAFRQLVKSGAHPLQVQSTVHAAASTGQVAILEELKKLSADLSKPNDEGLTPLMAAIESGKIRAVEFLLNVPVDFGVMDSGGDTALTRVVKKLNPAYITGDTEVPRMAQMILRRADIDQPGKFGRTPLMHCAEGGLLKEVQLLLQRGADPSVRDRDGYSALEHAASSGSVEVVRLLLDTKRVDVNAHTKDFGSTPLILAAYWPHPETVKLLLERGAPVNAADSAGTTALITSVEALSHPDSFRQNVARTVLTLLAHHAEVNAQNKNGYTPLLWAARHGSVDVAKILLSHGADPNVQENELKETALMMAVHQDSAEMVRLLRVSGADLHIQDINGRTALDKVDKDESPELYAALVDP